MIERGTEVPVTRQAQLLQASAEEWREASIRKPTGDTQRLRALFSSTSPSHSARHA
jgi:hypothetical protein